jgi:hypothetical protein
LKALQQVQQQKIKILYNMNLDLVIKVLNNVYYFEEREKKHLFISECVNFLPFLFFAFFSLFSKNRRKKNRGMARESVREREERQSV